MWLLRPFSWIYAAIMAIRNFLFDHSILKEQQFPIPTVSVGNLSVGGTGKTPHTEYLLRLLQKSGLQCATLSRGYGRMSHGFRWVSECKSAIEAGDEPWQLQNKFPAVRVSACEDRCEGMRHILSESPDVKAVILDDAFQHRYIKPGLSVLLTDYSRPYYSDCVLPEGRLRENKSGARRADIIVVTKCPDVLSEEEQQQIIHRLRPLPHQQVFFSRIHYGDLQPAVGERNENLRAGKNDVVGKEKEVGPLSEEAGPLHEEVGHLYEDNGHLSKALGHLSESVPQIEKNREKYTTDSPLLLCGIANPRPLEAYLRQRFPALRTKFFADHHNFGENELKVLENEKMIITTEKDLARISALHLYNNIKERLFVIPIDIQFVSDRQQEIFNQTIINYVRENTRNC